MKTLYLFNGGNKVKQTHDSNATKFPNVSHGIASQGSQFTEL